MVIGRVVGEKLETLRYYMSLTHNFSQKGSIMIPEEMLKKLAERYGRLPEKQPKGEARIRGHGKESGVAEERGQES
jgi:hypothetical protein